MFGSFSKKLRFSGVLAVKKDILKHFSKINTYKNISPYCGSSPPPGAMVLTINNSQSVLCQIAFK
jgi:hypothetical protein